MKMDLKTWWAENKVLVLGLAAAVIMLIQQATVGIKDFHSIDWAAVGMAVLFGAAGYIAKNWRGQNSSVIGLIVNGAVAITTVQATGDFSWFQVVLQFGGLYVFSVLPDAKSKGYERSSIITQAKIEGEIIRPAPLTNQKIKEEAQMITGKS